MPFWSWLCDCLSGTTHEQHDASVINPSTGLPMIDNSIAGIDVGGSPFGQDVHHSGGWTDFGGGFDGQDTM